MERPQIYFFLLPLAFVTLILYFKMLFVLWRKRDSNGSLFYKLIRTQDWPTMHNFLFALNDTFVVQLLYAHSYTCINGQILGVTLNSIGRALAVRYSTWHISERIDKMSQAKVMLIHWTPPIFLGLYIYFGETPSRFEFVEELTRVARVTDVQYVQINSLVSMTASVSGALISLFCYILIFLTLRKRTYRCWNTEASILSTSFILFLSLCAVAAYYLNNGLLSIINTNAMFNLRKHYYAFAFPISLLNPWCLLLTSAKIRKDVLGQTLSQTAVIQFLPSEVTPPKKINSTSRTTSSTRSTVVGC